MALFDTYDYQGELPLACPLLAFGGLSDNFASPDSIRVWRSYTSAAFDVQLFGGGHFFISEHRDEILATVAAQSLPQDYGG